MILSKAFYGSFLLIAMIGLIGGCSNEMNSSEVKGVKDGTLLDYSNTLTVGQAFDSWAKTQKCIATNWELIESDRGEKIVQATCDYDPQNIVAGAKENIQAYTEADFNDAMTKHEKSTYEDSHHPTFESNRETIKTAEALDTVSTSMAFTMLDKVRIIFQFPLAVDGQSFNVGHTGTDFIFKDGKTSSTSGNYMFSVYNNAEIEIKPSGSDYITRK